jgi:hypothetical protein
MSPLSVYQLKRKIEAIKEANRTKPDVYVTMWCPASEDTNGKSGFYTFNMRTPWLKVPAPNPNGEV